MRADDLDRAAAFTEEISDADQQAKTATEADDLDRAAALAQEIANSELRWQATSAVVDVVIATGDLDQVTRWFKSEMTSKNSIYRMWLR